MKKFIWTIIGVIIVLLIIVAAGDRKAPVSDGPIKIGSITALTGVGVSIGEEEYKGVALAVKEINGQGGVGGRPLELISEDLSIDKLKNSGTVMSKLINIDKVVGIIGPQWDEPALAILPMIDANKIPTIGPDTTDTVESSTTGAYFFSTWYDNRVGIEALLAFAQSKGWKKGAIIRPIDAGFWKFTSDLIAENASAYGITIIEDVNVNNPLATDFRTFITKVKAAKPDFVFSVTADPIQCIFFKQMREQNFTVPVLATESSGNKSSLDQCAADLSNLYFSAPSPNHPGYEEFRTAFMEEYGREPLFPSAVTAYDAVRIMAAALEKTGGEGGEVLQKELESTEDFRGASLPSMTFKSNGFVVTPPGTFEVYTVRDGKFVKVE